MGWIKDRLEDLLDWFVDKLIRPVIEWITDAIAWLVDELRYWKHKFFELLSGWLENDLFFLGAIIATICLAIYWPKIVAWLAETSLALMLKGLWEDVKKGVASILDFIHIIEVDTINTMLKILWPEWRGLMSQLADVTSALAEELGQGSAYIHAYFSVVHGLAIVGNSFMGTDPELAEMQAFEDTSEFLVHINENFKHYNQHPGEIIRDLIENVYLPYGENIRDAQTATIGEIRQNYERVQRVNQALHILEGTLTHFIEIQPEEMQEVISDRLQPVTDALTDALYVMDTEIMPKIESIIDAMELQSSRQQELNDNILARISDPYELLAQAEFMTDKDREALENYVAELESRAADREQEEVKIALDVLSDAMVDATKDRYVETPPVTQPARTALSFEMPGIPSTAEIPAWFVGEH